ncbi:unnamed protein product, partial [Staurois parvus]
HNISSPTPWSSLASTTATPSSLADLYIGHTPSSHHEYCCQAHPPYQLFIVCYPSLPIPPLTSTQCPPPLSANPSTGFHSVSSTPLCQSLH